MLNSLTHEIISMYSVPDPVEFFRTDEKISVLRKMVVDNDPGLRTIKFVHRKGVEFRDNLNYAWLLSCGFLPFRELMQFSALPTVVDSNKMEYFFDYPIQACSHDRHDVLYDTVYAPVCPVCNGRSKLQKLNRMEDLWEDFPIFKSISEVLEFGLIETIHECQKLKYPKTRLGVSENYAK